MSLVGDLAGGRATFAPRLGGIEPIRNVSGGCHAGAGHGASSRRGAFGDLCQACWCGVRRVLGMGEGAKP